MLSPFRTMVTFAKFHGVVSEGLGSSGPGNAETDLKTQPPYGTFRLALRVTYNGGGSVVARGDIEAPRSSLPPRGTAEKLLLAWMQTVPTNTATWYGCPKVAAAQAQVGRTTRYGPPVRPFPEVAVTGRTVPGRTLRWYVVRYGTLGG